MNLSGNRRDFTKQLNTVVVPSLSPFQLSNATELPVPFGAETDPIFNAWNRSTGITINQSQIVPPITITVSQILDNSLLVRHAQLPTISISTTGLLESTFPGRELSGKNTGDQNITGLVPYTGATGDLNMGVWKIILNRIQINNFPTLPTDGTNKAYVDAAVISGGGGGGPFEPKLYGQGFVKNTFGVTSYDNSTYSLSTHLHIGVYEPDLGLPAGNNYLLVSNLLGVRTWVAPPPVFTFPAVGIVRSTGTGWDTSIIDNSTTWNALVSFPGFGTSGTTAAVGNDSRILNGATAFGWGNWASNFGAIAGKITEGNDSRLTDARTPLSHVHGNIANGGTIGVTASLPIITGTAGILQVGSFGTGATDFCVGNDTRLSDARTPLSHTIESHTATVILNQVLKGTGVNTFGWGTLSAGDVGAEPALGNPGANGYVLVSTTGGVRSWVSQAGGMVYPSGSGIPIVVTGTSWGTTIADNSATWNSLVSFPGFGVTGTTACVGDDARLSDSRTPLSHTHGNIANGGTIGVTASLPIITGASGILQVGAFGTGATDFCVGNDSRLSDSRTPLSHSHGNITNGGLIGVTASLPIITGVGGILQAGSFGTGATDFCVGNDARLSDARTPLSHTHGNITNAGIIGSTANLPLITTTAGLVTTGSFGTGATNFCVGNDSRLSDARTPLSHTLEGHTATVTNGQFLKGTGTNTFGWAAHGLTAADVGAVPYTGATSDVNLGVRNLINTGYVSTDNFNVSAHYTGFPERTSTSLSFVPGVSGATRTLTLTATNAPIWINGVRYLINNLTSQITPDATNLYWFWITAPGGVPQLNNSINAPGFDKCLVATVYWNTTIDNGILSDERHWMGRDQKYHEYLHETFGARWALGLAGTFTTTTISFTAGEIYDEDLEFPYVGTTTDCKVVYKNGSSNFEWDNGNTTGYKVNGTRLRYNNGTALNDAGNGDYMAMWFYATNNTTYPINAIMGQRVDSTIANARLNNTPDSLSLGNLPSAEMKLIYRVIYRQVNATTIAYQEAADYRTVSSAAGGAPTLTDHSSLSNLAFGTSGHSGFEADLGLPGTNGDMLVSTTAGVRSWITPGGNHNMLSATHTDSLIDTVVRGDIMYGNATPKWARLPFPGTPTGKILQATATDIAWSTNPITIGASASVSGTNTGDITLDTNHGLSLTGQILAMGTPSTITTITTNSVTTTTHAHAITAALGLIGDGSAANQMLITGTTPFTPAWTLATNLVSLNALSWVSTAFVKMTAAGTFGLDTTSYAAVGHSQAESTITFTDITTGNASISAHGYLPKLGGGTTNFLRADGTWAAAGGSGTVNSGSANTLAYYAGAGTAVSGLTAITASRAIKSDANGLPVHFDTSTEPSLTELTYVKGVTSAIQTQLGTKTDKTKTLTAKSANYSIQASDADTIIECTGTFTVTFPNSMTTGMRVDIINVSTGVITLAASTTLNSKGSNKKLASQWIGASVYHRGSNVWVAVGDLTA